MVGSLGRRATAESGRDKFTDGVRKAEFEFNIIWYVQGHWKCLKVGGKEILGPGGRKSPSGVQGQSPGRGPGGRSPPEAESYFEIYRHICHSPWAMADMP